MTAKFLALVLVLACFCTSALSKVNYFVPGRELSPNCVDGLMDQAALA